ncbi:MAG: response regulator [Bacteroidia bacterium]
MNSNPLKILLADDDMDDCLFFKDALQKSFSSAELIIINEGEQLMNYLTNETNKIPDVLFLDLNMPRKNGFECLAEIKANKKLKHIPVIIYSTSLEQETIDTLYKNGASYFIRKPAEFQLFQKAIEKSLTLISQKKNSEITRESFILTIGND